MSQCGDSSMAEQSLFQETDGGSIPTSPLHMLIREVSFLTASNFYSKWHYLKQTDFVATVNYGSYFNDYLRGVISYGSPNAKKLKGYYDENSQYGWWEIKRLAMDDTAPRNSESRFIRISLKILRKKFPYKGTITLADSSVGHVGTIYKASGFKYLGLTAQKDDYVLNGRKVQRGKVSGTGGEWVRRPRKHLFILQEKL